MAQLSRRNVGSEKLFPELGVVGGEAVEDQGAESEGRSDVRVAVGGEEGKAVQVRGKDIQRCLLSL